MLTKAIRHQLKGPWQIVQHPNASSTQQSSFYRFKSNKLLQLNEDSCATQTFPRRHFTGSCCQYAVFYDSNSLTAPTVVAHKVSGWTDLTLCCQVQLNIMKAHGCCVTGIAPALNQTRHSVQVLAIRIATHDTGLPGCCNNPTGIIGCRGTMYAHWEVSVQDQKAETEIFILKYTCSVGSAILAEGFPL